jgi:hypothetical protein
VFIPENIASFLVLETLAVCNCDSLSSNEAGDYSLPVSELHHPNHDPFVEF